MPSVRGRSLVKSFRDGGREIHVLESVDIDVQAHEAVAVVGPSGSGKSTLLHLLGGLDRPDSGSVELLGRDLSTLGEAELADLRNSSVGFVFQFHQLLPDFTVLENVALPGRIAGLEKGALRDRALELLSQVGLDERSETFPSRLSGGECQRVSICRALLLRPAVVLADEPTGNLDPKTGETVLELFLEMVERHSAACVLVTHNPSVAARCARILALEGGSLTSYRPVVGAS